MYRYSCHLMAQENRVEGAFADTFIAIENLLSYPDVGGVNHDQLLYSAVCSGGYFILVSDRHHVGYEYPCHVSQPQTSSSRRRTGGNESVESIISSCE